MPPYGVIITAVAQSRRRGEIYAAIRTFRRLGIPIHDIVTAGRFEGGNFDMIEEGCALIGCGGADTEEVAARQVAGWYEAEGWEVRPASFDEYACIST